jgi:hypothetical protein
VGPKWERFGGPELLKPKEEGLEGLRKALKNLEQSNALRIHRKQCTEDALKRIH